MFYILFYAYHVFIKLLNEAIALNKVVLFCVTRKTISRLQV